MANSTKAKSTNGPNKPTHRVVFRRKRGDGTFTDPVELGGGWENSKGGISFSFAGGSVTVWPLQNNNTEVGA